MSQRATIEGLDDALLLFDKMPQNAVKIVKTSMKEASKATKKQIKTKVPPRFQRLVAYRVKRFRSVQELSALVGLFKPKEKKGEKEVSDWFKAYWKNYGTIKRRDPSHHFDYPVRHERPKRNKEGQYPEKFFEQAITGWESVFMNEFQKSLKEQEDKFYER